MSEADFEYENVGTTVIIYSDLDCKNNKNKTYNCMHQSRIISSSDELCHPCFCTHFSNNFPSLFDPSAEKILLFFCLA